MDRNASALWKGNLHEGEGTLTTESGVLSETQYSFRTRFAEGLGTNPDELIAASLGGCFSMALSNELGLCGFHPQRIETTATATLEDLGDGRTKFVSISLFHTTEERDGMMHSGMEGGMNESYAALDRVLAAMA